MHFNSITGHFFAPFIEFWLLILPHVDGLRPACSIKIFNKTWNSFTGAELTLLSAIFYPRVEADLNSLFDFITLLTCGTQDVARSLLKAAISSLTSKGFSQIVRQRLDSRPLILSSMSLLAVKIKYRYTNNDGWTDLF